MSSLPDGGPGPLDPGEAYQRCMRELGKPYPDFVSAQVYAILGMEETLRGVAAQMAELTHQITLASRLTSPGNAAGPPQEAQH